MPEMISGHKIWFLTFADSRFKSYQRLKNEASKLGWFDAIIAGDERLFETWYFNKYKDRFADRGYGYWQWKSYLIRRTMDQMNENDILLYCDGGCVLNGGGYSRLCDYAKIVSNHLSGVLLFDQGMDVRQWTKRDIFEYFGGEEKYIHHGQIAGGIILIRKCANSVKMIDEWYYICHNHYNLLTDSKSKQPELDIFIENRHDQSILNMLSIKYDAARLPFGELYREDEDWSKMIVYPIWAARKRDAQRSIYFRIKRKLKLLLKR